jgi:hypothetical protein
MNNGVNIHRLKIFIILLILILVTNFRSYYGVLLLGVYLISAYKFNTSFLKIASILSSGLIIAVLLFPAYRYTKTGIFWMPNLGMNKLQAGWWANPMPTNATLRELNNFNFPVYLSPNSLVNKGLDYDQATEIALNWRKNGMSDREINLRAIAAGELLAKDSKKVLLNRGLLALTSSGFILPYCYLNSDLNVFPGYSSEMFCRHIERTYKFHSWLYPEDPKIIFDSLFDSNRFQDAFNMPFQKLTIDSIRADTFKYIKWTSLLAKDPLSTGEIAPDWIIIFSLFVIIFSNRLQRKFSLMCAWLILGNFAINYLAPLGNPRYGYFLFPIYIAFTFLGVSRITSWIYKKLYIYFTQK